MTQESKATLLLVAMAAAIALVAGVFVGRSLPRELDPCHERAHQVFEAMTGLKSVTPDFEGMTLACVGEYLTDEERAELQAIRRLRGFED